MDYYFHPATRWVLRAESQSHQSHWRIPTSGSLVEPGGLYAECGGNGAGHRCVICKAPSTKHQAPGKLQHPSSNHAAAWCLEFGASLDVGVWCLELFFACLRSPWRSNSLPKPAPSNKIAALKSPTA